MELHWSFFNCAETEAWFIDSFEEWRKAQNLSNFILLGHSFGGYVAAKYALKVNCHPWYNSMWKRWQFVVLWFLTFRWAYLWIFQHPEHVQHLILVGSAGFSAEADDKSEWLTKFRATWKGAVLNHLWESNFTPQKLVRYALMIVYYSPIGWLDAHFLETDLLHSIETIWWACFEHGNTCRTMKLVGGNTRLTIFL